MATSFRRRYFRLPKRQTVSLMMTDNDMKYYMWITLRAELTGNSTVSNLRSRI